MGTWGVLFGLLIIAGGLLGLIAMVAPHVLGIVLVFAGFLLFGSLHYLIWGWWMRPLLEEQEAFERQSPVTPPPTAKKKSAPES